MIVIAYEKMLFSLKLSQIPFCRMGVSVCEITQDIDDIIRLNPAVPELNQGVVHLGDCLEGAVIKGNYMFMPEMQVGSVKYHKRLLFITVLQWNKKQ